MATKERTYLILTGTGDYLRGRFTGTRAQAKAYCKRKFMPRGYKIVLDKNWKGYKR